MLELMTAWIVILWRFAATYVRAKHDRAEMPNSNIEDQDSRSQLMRISYVETFACRCSHVGISHILVLVPSRSLQGSSNFVS